MTFESSIRRQEQAQGNTFTRNTTLVCVSGVTQELCHSCIEEHADHGYIIKYVAMVTDDELSGQCEGECE